MLGKAARTAAAPGGHRGRRALRCRLSWVPSSTMRPSLHDDDAVGGADGGEAVGDDDRGAVLDQPLERSWTSRSLSASSAEVASSSSSSGASRSIARAMAMRWRWPPDRRAPPSPMKVSRPCGSLRRNSAHWRLRPRPTARRRSRPSAVAQIVAGGGGEDHRLLRHQRDPLADVGGIGSRGRRRRADGAAFRIVEALGELEQGRLARARRADHRQRLAGAPHGQGEVAERRDFRAGGIAEVTFSKRARRARLRQRLGCAGRLISGCCCDSSSASRPAAPAPRSSSP
jgi:hypothetical protein